MSVFFDDLRNGVVLAELGGYGDGPYCARHGVGAALVVLGTYIVDPGDRVPYPPHFVFRPGRRHYAGCLREHVAAARASGAKVGVSAISIALEDTVDFLCAAQEAGADCVSLCGHSSMDMFAAHGLGFAFNRPENLPRLADWCQAISRAVTVPFICKLRFSCPEETSKAVETATAAGASSVHVNIGKSAPDSHAFRAIGPLAGLSGFLITGGGIADAKRARDLLHAGAGAVAVGSAAMKDAGFCGGLQAAIRPGLACHDG